MSNRKPKNEWIGSRVDDEMKERIEDYVDASDFETVGQLVRKALAEFMENHPVGGE